MKNERLIELAIGGLQETKKRIDAELSDLLALVGISVTTEKAPAGKKKKPPIQLKPGRKKMSPAKRKAISERMKASWAARKKAAK